MYVDSTFAFEFLSDQENINFVIEKWGKFLHKDITYLCC